MKITNKKILGQTQRSAPTENNVVEPFIGSLKKGNKKAFTLVELIVVITILAILSTIGFVAYSGYLVGTRDTSRIASLKAISEGLEMYSTRHDLPTPDKKTTKIMSGSTQIATQGYVGENVLETITYSTEGKDPKDGTYYSYYLTKDKKYFQLMAFLEEEKTTTVYNPPSPPLEVGTIKVQAIDYSTRYPTVFGKKLGILTTKDNEPIQESTGTIDISNVGTLELKSYLKDNDYLSGTGTTFKYMSKFAKAGGKFCATYNLECNDPNISITCPTGYIAVPGNPLFPYADGTVKDFCVAQYEMSYETVNELNTSNSRNTDSYDSNKTDIVSKVGKYPITELTQSEAINACKSLGTGYHLITNNEWMTIARNIEGQKENWSGGAVGNGVLYRGVSNDTTYGCGGKVDGTNRAGPTGSYCNGGKNKLKLSNGNYIYDLAGNVWEHVNRTNNTDIVCSGTSCSALEGEGNLCNGSGYWYNDGEPANTCASNYGPTATNVKNGSDKGMGYVRNNSNTNKVFLRGASATSGSGAGVFPLHLYLTSGAQSRYVGFRCAK